MTKHEILVERNLWRRRALAAEMQMAKLREQLRNLRRENQALSYALIEPSMTEVMLAMPRHIAPLLPGLEDEKEAGARDILDIFESLRGVIGKRRE